MSNKRTADAAGLDLEDKAETAGAAAGGPASGDPAAASETGAAPPQLSEADARRRLRIDSTDVEAQQVLVTGTTREGTFLWYNAERGVGQVQESGSPEGGALELPCWLKDVALVGFRSISRGRRLTFGFGVDDSKRLCAVNVRDPAGNPIQNGFLAGTETQRGKKESNEDRWATGESCGPLGIFFGIYDGHGGATSAAYAAKHLHKICQSRYGGHALGPRLQELSVAVKEAFAEADRSILSVIRRETSSHKAQNSDQMRGDGTTALGVFVMESPATGALSALAAWAGDSRALLLRGSATASAAASAAAGGAAAASGADGASLVLRLTEDHKPGRVDEKLRLRAAGGVVENIRGTWRVARAGGSVKSRIWLAVSRALGDLQHKEPTVLVSAEPELKLVPLEEDDVGLVLACDGIYDVLSDKARPGGKGQISLEEVGDIAFSFAGTGPASGREAAAAIVQAALRRGSGDNCTATVAFLARRCGTDASAEAVAAVTALREAAVERIQEAERQAAAPPAPAEELDMFA